MKRWGFFFSWFVFDYYTSMLLFFYGDFDKTLEISFVKFYIFFYSRNQIFWTWLHQKSNCGYETSFISIILGLLRCYFKKTWYYFKVDAEGIKLGTLGELWYDTLQSVLPSQIFIMKTTLDSILNFCDSSCKWWPELLQMINLCCNVAVKDIIGQGYTCVYDFTLSKSEDTSTAPSATPPPPHPSSKHKR
jgi:hypothetical protein